MYNTYFRDSILNINMQDYLARQNGLTPEVKEAAEPEKLKNQQYITQAQKEYDEVVAKYKGTGLWLKTPNGKDTNLTEKQWVQVRTPSFIKWFGDWMKSFRIKKLLQAETIELNWNTEAPPYSLDPNSAEEYIHQNYQGKEFVNEDTGNFYTLGKTGRQKLLSHSRNNEAYLKSLFFLPEIIRKSIFITEEEARKNNSKYSRYRYYVSGIKLDGIDYTAKSVFGLNSNGTWVYDQELSEIEKGALIGMRTKHVTQDSIQVKDTTLLSILQDDSSVVVDENGEPKLVYHGTSASFEEFDGTKNTYPNGFFVTIIKGTSELYAGKDGNVITGYANLKNPIQRSRDIRLSTEERSSEYVFDKDKFKETLKDYGFNVNEDTFSDIE